MRLGGPIFGKYSNADEWSQLVLAEGYRAAYCPIDATAPRDEIEQYKNVAKAKDIVIAEVGAWSNPISRDTAERAKALDYCKKQLAHADAIGAICCVNIAGSRGAKWDGPDESHYSNEVFEMIVASVREIIDEVKPAKAKYTLETMPWVPPDSPESYLKLIRAIDRESFGVHLDVVNMINCPERACCSGKFIRECFEKLGPKVLAIHAKDVRFTQHLTVHLDECGPGEGMLDYRTFLGEVRKLNKDVPVMLEHLKTSEEYRKAAGFVRGVWDTLNPER